MFRTIITISDALLGMDILLLLGCVYAVRRRDWTSWRFLFCAALIGVCWGWRAVFGILSGRYVFILIPVATAAAVCFLYMLPEMLASLRLSRAADAVRKHHLQIARGGVILLVCAFIAKDMHVNPYEGEILGLMRKLGEEVSRSPGAVVCNYYDPRVGYYARVPAERMVTPEGEKLGPGSMVSRIREHAAAETIFFVGKIPRAEADSPELRQLSATMNLVKLSESWHNRRRRDKVVLYRFTRSR